MEQLGPHQTDFHEIWYLGVFRKSCENSNLIKIWEEKLVFRMKTEVYLRNLSEFFLERYMIQIEVLEKIKTRTFYSFPKIFAVYTKMWKYLAEPSRTQMTTRRVIITWYRTVLFVVTRWKSQLKYSLIAVTTFSLLIPTDIMMIAGS